MSATPEWEPITSSAELADLGVAEWTIERRTAREMCAALRQYDRNRPDFGFRKAMSSRLLQPPNPFEPQALRPPQRWSVLFSLLAAMAIGCFVYFNLLQ